MCKNTCKRTCCFPNMTLQFVDDGRLQMLEQVGHGGWGVVYRARDFSSGTPKIVAVKVVLKAPKKSNRAIFLRREIENHRRMSFHPNVVGIHRMFTDKLFVYVVLDYCPGGDMWRAIQDRTVFARNEGLVKHVFIQLIDAVQACHDKGIYHRDLKPNNVLVNHDCTKVWISDFGLSTGTKYSDKFNAGTGPYKSPECCNFGGMHAGYSVERQDIWALGIILINMISGTYAWKEASTDNHAYLAYLRNPHFLRSSLPISEEANFILDRIFASHEAESITLANLRLLIRGVKTFWMSEEDVAKTGPRMTWIKKPYLYRESDSSEDGEDGDNEQGYGQQTSTNSLADDSDDSDEHSVGVRSRSLLALEEGLHGVAVDAADKDPNGTHHSTPLTPSKLVATTPKQQAQSLLVPPAPAKPSSSLKSSGTPSSSASCSRSENSPVSPNSHQKMWLKGPMSSVLRSSIKLPVSVRRFFGAKEAKVNS